jgi:hypothetical protein
MALPRRQPLDDEIERLQPVFHAMEKYFASFPRYGKLSSTVWKTRGNAPARTILYADLRARNPAPRFMKMRAEQWGPGYGPQAAAMHTLPHAAHLSSTARGPIQTPDVGSGRKKTNGYIRTH